jgi:hypothetical protein
MPEATRERGEREDGERVRAATEPPAETRSAAEPDREVENYRDEYDFENHDAAGPGVDHRS